MLFYREEDVLTFDQDVSQYRKGHAVTTRQRSKTILGISSIIIELQEEHQARVQLKQLSDFRFSRAVTSPVAGKRGALLSCIGIS